MSERVELPDSARTVREGAQNQGAFEGGLQVSVTVYVRRNPDAKPPFDVAEEARKPPGERRYLTADEAREVYGATTADIDAVRAFAASLGLDVVGVNPAARSIKLSGTADAVGRAFGVKLNRYSHGNVPYRSYEGPVSVPPELASVVEAVIGLDNRPLGRKHLRRAPTDFAISVEDLAAEAKPPALPANNYYPPQVAALYDFPSQSASGETVAVLAFNGMPNDQGDPQPGGYQPAVLQS